MKKVKLLKDGTPHGNAGDVVEVSDEMYGHLVSERKQHCMLTQQDIPYRIAKPYDEKEPELSVEDATAAELLAAGKKNIVETPKSELEKGFPGVVKQASVMQSNPPVVEEEDSGKDLDEEEYEDDEE